MTVLDTSKTIESRECQQSQYNTHYISIARDYTASETVVE
jgi:hypothetical protein